MASRRAILLLAGLLCVSQAFTFSLDTGEFDKLIKPRCFNRSATSGAELVLGQNEPIGMSIENIISMLERMERLNPNLKPDQVLRLFLQRFHIDGVRYYGNSNQQSNLEYQHAQLTEAILSDFSDQLPDFPESQFSEDEKCNLFFTISHAVNMTAQDHEPENQVYHLPNMGKAPARNLGKEVPVAAISTTPKAVQSSFLEETEVGANVAKSKKQKRNARELMPGQRLTRKPREYGAASFLGSKTNPIAVNRVLLGMLVGFSSGQLKTKKMSEILKIMNKSLKIGVTDKDVDNLLAVTLSDLLGIDTDEGMNFPGNKAIFGVDGEWNSTVCHTQFVLNSADGTWSTMAEFRGGLDGWNIGNYLPNLLKIYPDIKASQVLRFYYSRNGLSHNDGICNRGFHVNKSIRDDLQSEAINYLGMWNSVFHSNQYTYETLTGYLGDAQTQFLEALDKATYNNDDEKAMCQGEFNSDIRSKPVESNVDALFVLDINRKCTLDLPCNQAAYVASLAKSFRLGRNFGSASVLFNARGVENPNLVDDEMRPVVTPLYSVLYNSTSNECAACKAANYDSSAREVLNDRVELFSQLNLTLANFEEKRSNESGVPSKAVFWFDFGTVHPIPSDKIQKVKYEQVKRQLLYVQRDWTFFGLGVNTSALKDLVTQEGNLVSVDSNEVTISTRVNELAQKVAEVPGVFQYGDCRRRASNNATFQGLITPGYKQYWALYPDTFRASSTIQLRFRAESTAIQVCQNRVPKPEGNNENCKRATKANEEISWVIYTPCKGMTFEKCPPIYFTVTVDKVDTEQCKDPRCQNIDQVSWTFSHTGISCNGASGISLSLLLIAFASILSRAFARNSF